jgi:HK97 family phage major capsid protein
MSLELILKACEGIETKLKNVSEKADGELATLGKVTQDTKTALENISIQQRELADRLLQIEQKGTARNDDNPAVTSWGEQFIARAEFKAAVAQGGQNLAMRVPIECKSTTISNSTTVFPMQKPGVISGAFVPLTVRAVLRSIPVSTNAVNALKENTWVASAAEVSEGAAKPESDITFTNYDVNIRTVAHWLKVSNALLADAPAIAAYIDTRLRDGLAQRVETQLISGNGTSPNISGLTDSGNFTAYTPTSDDNLADAINRIKYTMWAAGYMPEIVIVNPADWGALERIREGAGSGTYLYGQPGSNAASNPFGLRVVLSARLNAGKIIVMDSTAAMIYDRQSVTVEMGYVNTDFTSNLVTIRAEERLALACERPGGIYYGDFTA